MGEVMTVEQEKLFRSFNPPKWWRFRAITLPPIGIFIRTEHSSNQQIKRHELVHWEQYKRYGLFMFYAMYLWYSIWYGYWDNPMEVEAREKS